MSISLRKKHNATIRLGLFEGDDIFGLLPKCLEEPKNYDVITSATFTTITTNIICMKYILIIFIKNHKHALIIFKQTMQYAHKGLV